MIFLFGRIFKILIIFLKYIVCVGVFRIVNKILYLLFYLNVDRLNLNLMKIYLYKFICLIYN